MTKEGFLSALKDIVNRAETKEEFLDSIVEDTEELIEDFDSEEEEEEE